ncbi:MAG: hypothetical protein DIZ77_14160 [endosymbiont of Seepiophila jonesi]|uniref:Uncharacterized protein n=1 Tax=endosymbiont of Lamellibrachia luymesi TaxID=2200907 RepID=A0A370DYG5_9GAMM|nr:MAG: hypothetical protein DIZ77_14160 [endosymbiont of Seepiophila jonesi]RDH91400.1 MAG: hypothetical protein DIZ79_06240 [endosymbiont of Lamellibrachia luymesi]
MAAAQNGIDPKPRRKGLNRLLQPLLRLVIPTFLRSLDRRLLLHRPLIWRTRVHYFVWFSLILANPVLYVLGWLYPVSRTSVPTIAEFGSLMGWLVLALWVFQQFRSPLGEFGWRKTLLTAVLYMACFFMLQLNPLSFALPVVQRIADVTPDGEFAQEYAFHERYGFWCCHPELDREVVQSSEKEIRSALRRYGIDEAFRFSFRDKVCGYDRGCLMQVGDFDDEALPPLPLGDVLKSVYAAKAFSAGSGDYFERTIAPIPLYILLSIIAAGVLTLSILPLSIRNRRLGMSERRFGLPRLRLPHPRLIGRVDRYLRIRKPLVWSAGLHSFLLLFLLYGILMLGIVFGAAYLVTRGEDIGDLLDMASDSGVFGILGIIAAFTILPAIWAIRQSRMPIKATTILANQAVLLLYFTAVLCPQLVLFLVMYATGHLPTGGNFNNDVILVMAVASLYVVGLALLGKYLDARRVIVALVLGLFVWGLQPLFLVLDVQGKEIAIVGLGVGFLLVFTIWVTARLSKKSFTPSLLSGVYIMYFPIGFLFVGVAFDEFLDMANSETEGWVLMVAIPLYLVAIIPALKVLVRYRYWPKP